MSHGRSIERDTNIDQLQSDEYKFPYHYIPTLTGDYRFARSWVFAPSYIAAITLAHDWLRGLVAEEARAGHRHVDFGCGDGGFLNGLTELGGLESVDFAGVDIDQGAIGWADTFNRHGVDFRCGDLRDLPAAFYDSGSLVEVVEHIPPAEAEGFIDAVAAALKPGAQLFVTVPSVEKPVESKHYRHFSFDDIAALFGGRFEVLERFGFERPNLMSRVYMRFLFTRRLYVEFAPLSDYLVRLYAAKHERQDGCGRIGLILRKT
jgi:SAM-dependent methyltransferase